MWFLKHSLFFCFVLFFVSSVPDFSVDTLSTNASQELQGLGIPKVSGLERSQEKSQETSRELSSATPSLVPTSHPKPPLPAPFTSSRPPSNRGLPLPPSPAKPSTLAQSVHWDRCHPLPPCLKPRAKSPLRHPQPSLSTHLSLHLTQGHLELQAFYHHPPSPALPTQQNPTQPLQHRPPSRCHPRPISAYSSSLTLNGLRWVRSKWV